MITKEEIKHLADLARIEAPENELDRLTSQIDSILNYVGQINKAVSGEIKKEAGDLRNIMRSDMVTVEPGEYTEAILANAPQKEGKYFKVKKILQ